MKPIQDDTYRNFVSVTSQPAFVGVRVKDRRHEALKPGGRCELTLFERAGDDDRAHPRLRVSLPPATDPSPPGSLYTPPRNAPADAAAYAAHLAEVVEAVSERLNARDLKEADAPLGSERYWRNSVRVQRIAAFFDAATAQLDEWVTLRKVKADKAPGFRYALRSARADAYSGLVQFDDGDTGTYHSFGHDAPFVHYMEKMIDALPEEGSEAFSVLSPDQQESVRRQREHASNHLDHIMRHKYAHDGIVETNIERSLGGLLIDRETRHIASETEASAHSLVPRYELLRVRPDADHPKAGEWVYRDGARIRLENGDPIDVKPDQLRGSPVDAERLTFKRAPGDPRLRSGVRFDWDSSGFVSQEPISWVGWAGHCDIKGIMEALGLSFDKGALADRPFLEEYRSDTGKTTRFEREHIIEMIASVMELGSSYVRTDGSGRLIRGQHLFGGARNDSRPDRLQFEGLGAGRHFRWPLSNRQESFVVTRLEIGGESVKVEESFLRYTPDLQAVDFAPNPRFLKTVEGDYNLIDVSGARVTALVKVDGFDVHSGYPTRTTRELVVDLRANPDEKRQFLGTHIKDPANRELYELYLDRGKNRIEAQVWRYEKGADGKWSGKELKDQAVNIPLARKLSVTLSREMKSDDPEVLDALIRIAVRQAQNICADTDQAAEVWNGVVTRIESKRVAVNAEARVEHWEVNIKARFGSATSAYLMRLDDNGSSVAWCPIPTPKSPDFLWQDFPDVGSKGVEGRDWVVNESMLQRGIVEVKQDRRASGGVYVYDDHVKNVFEMLWSALSGNRYTILHDNKRYAFPNRDAWREAVRVVSELRGNLKFQ